MVRELYDCLKVAERCFLSSNSLHCSSAKRVLQPMAFTASCSQCKHCHVIGSWIANCTLDEVADEVQFMVNTPVGQIIPWKNGILVNSRGCPLLFYWIKDIYDKGQLFQYKISGSITLHIHQVQLYQIFSEANYIFLLSFSPNETHYKGLCLSCNLWTVCPIGQDLIVKLRWVTLLLAQGLFMLNNVISILLFFSGCNTRKSLIRCQHILNGS